MSAEENKAAARRFNDEVWGARNLGAIDELVAEEAVVHDTASPEPVEGRAGARRSVEEILAAFPDSRVEILHIVAEGDLVAIHFRATGIHHGEFQGIEPTGNRIVVTGMSFQRMRDGQMVEEWQILDVMGLLGQLGAVPA